MTHSEYLPTSSSEYSFFKTSFSHLNQTMASADGNLPLSPSPLLDRKPSSDVDVLIIGAVCFPLSISIPDGKCSCSIYLQTRLCSNYQGPAGLMAAASLARYGIHNIRIVDKRSTKVCSPTFCFTTSLFAKGSLTLIMYVSTWIRSSQVMPTVSLPGPWKCVGKGIKFVSISCP